MSDLVTQVQYTSAISFILLRTMTLISSAAKEVFSPLTSTCMCGLLIVLLVHLERPVLYIMLHQLVVPHATDLTLGVKDWMSSSASFARQLCLYRSLWMILPKPPILCFQMLYFRIGVVQQQAKRLRSWHDSPLGLRHCGFLDRPPNVTICLWSERFTLNFTKASASTSLFNPITQQV